MIRLFAAMSFRYFRVEKKYWFWSWKTRELFYSYWVCIYERGKKNREKAYVFHLATSLIELAKI